MEQFYTDERNVQILIALLKKHGIKHIVASPGSTNVTFVGSVQQDSFFEIYSCVDERSAAYMACGLAAEIMQPVVLSCTGATASRNYFPALTEAYYRKLPVLAVTSTQEESKIGQLIPQVIDRSIQPADTVKMSVHLQTVKDDDDQWNVMLKANMAILELNHRGYGPVHINLTTRYSKKFAIKSLPEVNKISRVMPFDSFPELSVNGKIAIYIGTHLRWTEAETELIDKFCTLYNAVVFNDPASNFHGHYRLDYALNAAQSSSDPNRFPDLLIHVGEMSDFCSIIENPKQVWRISPDGKVQDRYHALSHVFEMPESYFFQHYNALRENGPENDSYLQSCLSAQKRILSNLPQLPFSHLYVASKLYDKLPKGCTLHLGILSPLRSWGYFPLDKSIEVYCNEGGFGIDGNMSSLLGASLACPDKLFFGVVGDLSFFYDMNVLGNRHIQSNFRILLINNSLGAEFHLFKQLNSVYVNNIDKYLSAGNHFGNQSPVLVKHYAENLGYEYLSASSKEEFIQCYERFVTPELTEKPMIFEIFTQVDNENEALKQIWNIEEPDAKTIIKQSIKKILGDKGVNLIKEVIK